MEGAAVVEAGERVELRELAGLGEAPRGDERRPGAAGDALERVDGAVEEAGARRAAERRERAERLVARAQRHDQPGPRARRAPPRVVQPVAVDDLDRAQVRARAASASAMPLRLLGETRARRCAARRRSSSRHERRVDAGQRGDLRERVLDQLVRVERRGELGARRPTRRRSARRSAATRSSSVAADATRDRRIRSRRAPAASTSVDDEQGERLTRREVVPARVGRRPRSRPEIGSVEPSGR